MMDLYDFDSDCAETYTKQCECGKTHEVSTQEDHHPEYYTDVKLMCKCG